MNKQIEELALEISKILEKEYNMYTKVEIDSFGVKVVSIEEYAPLNGEEYLR